MSTTYAFEKPWVEKYRPEFLKDIVGNQEIVSQLETIAKDGNLPNLILSGPPGTGKTSSVMALAHELLGANFKKATIELNASDDRGIDVVRDKIKAFATQKINLPENRHKIIILDEADSMTEIAQQALRIIISDYSNTTRFALACNDSTKIIEPLQSRCSILRYSKLKPEEIKQRLLKIIELEQIKYEEEGLNDLVDTCEGDMRYALNNLQSTFIGFEKVTHETVYKIIDIPKPEALMKIISFCENSDLNNAIRNVDSLYKEGYNSMDILSVFGKVIKSRNNIFDAIKFKMLKEITKYKVRFMDGIDSNIQIYGFLSDMILLFKENSKSSERMDLD